MNTPCPSTAELASLLARRLEGPRAREVREHALQCADCYEVLTESATFELEEEGEPVGVEESPDRWSPARPVTPQRGDQWRRATPLGLSAAAALVIAMGAVCFLWLSRVSRDPVQELIAASPGARPDPVRFSGFPYAPMPAAERGAEDTEPSLTLLAQAAQLEREAASRPTAPTLHALGVAQVLLGRYDEAVHTLRRARRLAGASAIDDDLAAVLVARGLRGHAPRSLSEGLEILSRQAAATRSPASRFNEALALEALGLDERAAAAWERYLRADDASGWAEEARSHLRRLRDRTEQPDAADRAGGRAQRAVREVSGPRYHRRRSHGRRLSVPLRSPHKA